MAKHAYDNTHSDMDYEAENDARSLSEAVAILKDSKRLGRTHKALKRMEKEEAKKSLEYRVAAKLKKL